MGDTFSVLPCPVVDESLTSYIFRVARANYVLGLDIFAYVNRKYQIMRFKDAHQFDMYPNRVGDVELLIKMLGLINADIDYMTFTPLFEKFTDSGLGSNDTTRGFMQGVLNTKTRRFCPYCLQDIPAFKRTWQVAEIEICDTHGMHLTDACSHCGQKQPYMHELLGYGRCVYCEGSLGLSGHPNSQISTEVTAQQHALYTDWEYLLEPKSILIPRVTGSVRQSLGICLLYLSQNREKLFNKEHITELSPDYVTGCLRFVRDPSSEHLSTKTKRYRPSVTTLLKFLRSHNFSLSEFSSLSVPTSYIHTVMHSESEVAAGMENQFQCLAPWCKNFSTSHAIQPINYLRNQFIHKGRKFINPHICWGCYVIYGFDAGTGVWSECEDIIGVGWTKIVPLIEKGHSRRDILRTNVVAKYGLSRLAGYFSCFGIVSLKFTERDKGHLNMDSLACLKQAQQEPGSLIHNAKRLFGWRQVIYWHHFYNDDVQRYFYMDFNRSPGPRGKPSKSLAVIQKVNREIERRESTGESISLNEIADVVGYAPGTLVSYKLSRRITQASRVQQVEAYQEQLWEKAEELVSLKRSRGETLSEVELFTYLGKGKKSIMSNLPELLNWFREQQEGLIKEKHRNDTDTLLIQVTEATLQIVSAGLRPSFQRVAEYAGVAPGRISERTVLGQRVLRLRALLEHGAEPQQIRNTFT